MVAVLEPAQVDPKRLARLAREPARVYGFSEVRTYRWPVAVVKLAGEAWFGPGHGPWMFKGDDCPVLRRAVEKMGTTRTNGTHASTLGNQLVAEGEAIVLPEPELVTLGDKHIVAVHILGGGVLLPAVPVAYAERRFGAGHWEKLVTLPVVRYHAGTEAVALVAAMRQ